MAVSATDLLKDERKFALLHANRAWADVNRTVALVLAACLTLALAAVAFAASTRVDEFANARASLAAIDGLLALPGPDDTGADETFAIVLLVRNVPSGSLDQLVDELGPIFESQQLAGHLAESEAVARRLETVPGELLIAALLDQLVVDYLGNVRRMEEVEQLTSFFTDAGLSGLSVLEVRHLANDAFGQRVTEIREHLKTVYVAVEDATAYGEFEGSLTEHRTDLKAAFLDKIATETEIAVPSVPIPLPLLQVLFLLPAALTFAAFIFLSQVQQANTESERYRFLTEQLKKSAIKEGAGDMRWLDPLELDFGSTRLYTVVLTLSLATAAVSAGWVGADSMATAQKSIWVILIGVAVISIIYVGVALRVGGMNRASLVSPAEEITGS